MNDHYKYDLWFRSVVSKNGVSLPRRPTYMCSTDPWFLHGPNRSVALTQEWRIWPERSGLPTDSDSERESGLSFEWQKQTPFVRHWESIKWIEIFGLWAIAKETLKTYHLTLHFYHHSEWMGLGHFCAGMRFWRRRRRRRRRCEHVVSTETPCLHPFISPSLRKKLFLLRTGCREESEDAP